MIYYLLIASVLLIIIPRKLNSSKQVPGMSVVGRLRNIINVITGKLHISQLENTKRYGKIYRLRSNVVNLSDPEEVKRVLTDSKTFYKNEFAQAHTKGLLDDAMFILPTGHTWHRHRKLLAPAFSPQVLRYSASTSARLTQLLIQKFDHGVNDVDIHFQLTLLTLDIIGDVDFGSTFGCLSKQGLLYPKIKSMQKTIVTSFVKRLVIPLFLWDFFNVGVKSEPIIKCRQDMIDVMVETRNSSRRVKSTNVGMNIMDRLELCNDDEKLAENEIWGEMIAFFLAGHETLANTLTFCLWELAKNFDVQEKLFAEVDGLNLEDADLFTTASKLKYLDQVMKETQRRHTVVGAIYRNASKNVEILGYPIEQGTRVAINIRALHMDPEYYHEPETFNPDRWLSGPKFPNTFLPFSDGPHNCIGKKMAEIEFKVVLLSLVQKFQFSLSSKSNPKLYTSITHKVSDLYLDIKPR